MSEAPLKAPRPATGLPEPRGHEPCGHTGGPASLLGPVDPSFRVLSGRLKFTVRRHKFNNDSLFSATCSLPEPSGHARLGAMHAGRLHAHARKEAARPHTHGGFRPQHLLCWGQVAPSNLPSNLLGPGAWPGGGPLLAGAAATGVHAPRS